jgi:hypothetical protein
LPLGVAAGNARFVDLNADDPEIVITSNHYSIQVFPNTPAAESGIISTSTTLAASAPSISVGQPLTLTATVSASSGSALPNGSVTFFDGSTAIGTVTLGTSGKAVLTTSALTKGSHMLMATYGGSPAFAVSGSSTVTVAVNAGSAPQATTTALAASATSVQFAQAVSFTATVSAAAGTPAGSVTFSDGSTALGMAALDSGGKATLATSSLALGSHAISAAYAGGAGFAASKSAAVTVTITSAASGGGHSGGGAVDLGTLFAMLWLLQRRKSAPVSAAARH